MIFLMIKLYKIHFMNGKNFIKSNMVLKKINKNFKIIKKTL